MNQTPHDALDQHERNITETLAPALVAAEAALTSATDVELPERIAARDRARRALEEAHGRTTALEAAVQRAAATKQAEERRQAEAAAEEARRAAEDAKRSAREAEQAPFLAALAGAVERANAANLASAESERARVPVAVLELVALVLDKRTETERKACADHIRARLAAEALEVAIVGVDAAHPAAVAARAQVRALGVHREIADIDEARVLFAAARAMNAAAYARIGDRASSPIGASVIALDGATTPAEKDRAHRLAAPTASYPKAVTLAEVGRLTLEGRGHDVHAIIAERGNADAVAALAARLAGPMGSVGAARGAVAIIAHARRSGVWAAPEEQAHAAIAACGKFLGDQVAALVAEQGTGRVFRVATAPGAHPATNLPQLVKDDPKRPGCFTAPAPPRDQIAAFIFDDKLAELADVAADLVPNIEARTDNAFAAIARGAAQPASAA